MKLPPLRSRALRLTIAPCSHFCDRRAPNGQEKSIWINTEAFPKTLDFQYIKSNNFRVVHGDGVFGGVTPSSYITMGFYSERGSIPQKVTHEINSEGGLGRELERTGKSGVAREIEVEVVVDLPTARGLVDWLGEHVSKLEQRAQGSNDRG